VDFELSQEQRALRDVSRGLLADHCAPAHVRAAAGGADADPKLWELGSELGWTGLLIPESHGGSGAGLAELTLVAEELGRAAARGPFLPAALAGLAISRHGSPELRELALPALASGSATAAWAVAESGGWFSPAGTLATAADSGVLMLSGSKTLVQDAASAEWLLVTAMVAGEPCLVVADRASPGTRVRRQQTLDLTRNLYEVVFDDVRVPAARRLSGRGAAVAEMLDAAAVLTAADALGAGTRLLEMTVEYAKSRVQFGQPIGAFQAVKHKAADMLMLAQGTRAAVYYAAMALDAATPDAAEAVSTAKAFASDGMSRLAGDALQTHGGIGFTWEHDLHLFLRRIKADEQLYGDATVHRERLCGFLASRQGAGALVGGGKRAGTLDGKGTPVDGERSLAGLGDEQFEAEIILGVPLPEQGALHLIGVGNALRRADGLGVRHDGTSAGDADVRRARTHHDDRGGIDGADERLPGPQFHEPSQCQFRKTYIS
jgi:alkylation response protein AidB-like acyl-CoA dehydrogenase